MTGIPHWFSPEIMRPLSWALLHFLWQGCALAALLYGAMAVSRNATVRYAMAMITLVLMVAAPVGTFVAIQNWIPAVPGVHAASTPATPLAPMASEMLSSGTSSDSGGAAFSSEKLVWLAELWIVGVLLLSVRTFGGFLLVERLRRTKASPAPSGIQKLCLDVQKRIGIARAVQFCQCNGLDVPAVVGWLRPLVLLPMTALTGLSEPQLEAVIAHELAHVKRLDYFANLLQIVAETLLFYHPAVWWVSRRLRAERENCCDDIAISVCGDAVAYARALTFMEGGRTAPVFALAANGSPFAQRVMRLVGVSEAGGGIRSAGFVVSLCCLVGAFVAGNFFLAAAHAAPTQPPRAVAAIPTVDIAVSSVATVVPLVPVKPVLRLAQAAKPETPTSPARADTPKNIPAPPTKLLQAVAASPDHAAQGSYIEGLKSVGVDGLTVDQLIALKIQDVTPEYVRAMRDLGLQPRVDDLIAMRIQGVTPEYVKAVHAAGLNVDTEKIIAMKIQSVTPEYLSQVRNLGFTPSADDLIAMRIQDVSPNYVREIRADGLNPSMDQIIAMRIQGITPGYVKGLRGAGLTNLSVDDLIAAKIQGLTPGFVEKVRSHGFQNLSLDKLMSLKNADVF